MIKWYFVNIQKKCGKRPFGFTDFANAQEWRKVKMDNDANEEEVININLPSWLYSQIYVLTAYE